MRSVGWLFVSVILCASSVLHADTWARYGSRRVLSESGSVYAIVDGRAFDGRHCGVAPATVHVVRRIDSDSPLDEVRVQTDALPDGDPLGLVAPGDVLLHSVELDQLPSSLSVLDDGRLVVVDSYASLGRHALVILVDTEGTVRHRLMASDLFQRFDERFSGSVSSTSWRALSWVDTEHQELLLITTDDAVKVVDLESGVVSDRELAAALLEAKPPADVFRQQRLWEIAFTAQREGLLDASDAARPVLGDETAPLELRVRAASVVGLADPDAARDTLLAGLESEDRWTVRWSWRTLAVVLGEQAIPRYRAAFAEGWTRHSESVVDGLASLGPRAVPVVLDMLLEPGTGVGVRYWLPQVALSRLESAWLETGEEDFHDGDVWEADRRAFHRLRDESDLSALTELFERRRYGFQGDQICVLALPALEWVRRNPDPKAAAPVVTFLASLQRKPHRVARWNERLIRACVESLRACTGLELGASSEAWRAALVNSTD